MGRPGIEGALAWLDCTIEAGPTWPATTTSSSAGCSDLGGSSTGNPLLFYRGRYAATDPGTGPTEVVDTLLAWPHHADWM